MNSGQRSSATTWIWIAALLLLALLAGCGGGGGDGGGMAGGTSGSVAPGPAGSPGAAATNPTVGSASPSNNSTNIPTTTTGPGNVTSGATVTANFTVPMNPATIVSPLTTFTLQVTSSGALVSGTVTMNAADTVATFTPSGGALASNTMYTAIVSTAATSAGGTRMSNPVQWTFTTAGPGSNGESAVNLGTAGNFAILAETAITDVPSSAITGNVGLDPASGAAIGVTCAEVVGTIYSDDAAGPLPCRVDSSGLLVTAVADMGTAYNDAAGRGPATPANTNIGAGTLTTQPFAPGLYTWTSAVNIPAATTITLAGGPDDVWIFQIAGTLTTSATANMVLSGGAKAKNVFWQVAGASVNVGAAPANFDGIILAKFAINFGASATASSRLLAQSAVSLSQNPITQPPP